MTADSATPKPKKSWLKLVLFSLLCLAVSSLVVGWMLFGHYAVLYYWNGELNKALLVAKSDSELGKTQIDKVFNDAIKAKVAPDILMRMYRVYGMSLYMQGEIARADEQIDKCIALGANEPPSNAAVADQLTHAWQDRATERHYHWLTDPKIPDGSKDQEMSVKVAETAFGPDHEQTIFKAAGLAKFYADIGRHADADKLIERCVKAAETKPSAQITAWYVYAMLAHIRAVQHKYKDAIGAYLKSRELAGTEEDSERGWSEMISGFRLHKGPENPLYKQSIALLNKGKYAELDRLADKFIKAKTEEWDGRWLLYYVTRVLEYGEEVNDIWYNQRKLDLNSWLVQNPKSTVARSALASLHVYRAWRVRENDVDGSRFKKLMNEAKKTLAVSPGIEDRDPHAYEPMLRLTYLGQDKRESLKVSEKGLKRWPTYFPIDKWTTRLLHTGLLGAKGDQENYINKRADTIGGAQGDKFYARFAWRFFDNGEHSKVFGRTRHMDWNRIKRGFKQLFKEYPDEAEARIAFLQLALTGNHEEDVRNTDW